MKLTNFPNTFKGSKGWQDKFYERFNINIEDLSTLKEDWKQNPKLIIQYRKIIKREFQVKKEAMNQVYLYDPVIMNNNAFQLNFNKENAGLISELTKRS